MALSKNSKKYKQLVKNLNKARAARSRNAKARRQIRGQDTADVLRHEYTKMTFHPILSPLDEPLPTSAPKPLDILTAKRDRLNVAIEVLRELEG